MAVEVIMCARLKKLMLLIKVLLTCAAMHSNTLIAMDVIDPGPSFGEKMGKASGECLANGIQALVQRNRANKEEKRRRVALEQEMKTIEHLITNYNLSRHTDCLAEVVSSNLKDEVKLMLLKVFDDHYKAHQRKKFWSATIKISSALGVTLGFIFFIKKRARHKKLITL